MAWHTAPWHVTPLRQIHRMSAPASPACVPASCVPADESLPRALLFDLGRVVIRLDMNRTFAIWAAAARGRRVT